jgi:hypothetical protein
VKSDLELKKCDLKILRLKTALAELDMKLCERQMEIDRLNNNIEIQLKAIKEVEIEKEELING